MCGIVAQIHNKKTKRADCNLVSKMLYAIEHRGMDQVCVHDYGFFSIGFRRLSITDININQPGRSNNWTVYLNGEIYNYKELGYEGTECEVLAQGFEQFGPDFVTRLNGMFVIIAEKNKEEVYLFRDRYGIKPVYHWRNPKDGSLIIASEIKAILIHPDFEFKVNDYARRQWLYFNNILTNETLFDSVFKLDKGCYLHVNSMEFTNYWYWKFDNGAPMSLEVAKKKVFELVSNSIRRQIPKVSYGSCLSGGIDSNIINAGLDWNCYTFSAGFNHKLDESEFARAYGKRHYSVNFNRVRFFKETIYHLEDLRVGASWSNYGLYELASHYVKVLFDGAGGDELFGGYQWRYKERDYLNVVNRTKINDRGMEELFYSKFGNDSFESRLEFDANHFLEGVLLVVDKLSMAHTIETRVPFLDNELVDFCLKLPNEFRQNKNILKEAFSEVLTEDILNRPKQGFSSPDWFKGEGNQAKKWSEAAFNQWLVTFKP